MRKNNQLPKLYALTKEQTYNCLEFKSYYTGKGVKERPAVYVNGVQTTAARHILEQKLGRALLSDELCCHHCDNQYCVNPHHLYVGSYTDNNRDRELRGRSRTKKGYTSNAAKFTPEQAMTVIEQKASGATVRQLAELYNVSRSCIEAIVYGKRKMTG